MYRLLLLDIDGTLRDESLGIPHSARHAIALCRDAGCKVVICTGRSIGTIQDDVMALAVDGYIAGGGCYIEYEDELLCDRTFDHDSVSRAVEYLKQQNTAFTIESSKKVFMNKGAKAILEAMNQLKSTKKNINKQFVQEKIQYDDNINTYSTQKIHKICLWSSSDVFKGVKSILGHTMELAQADISGKKHYYEIIQKGCHKGQAIALLQKKLGISREETICFGDGQNDIAMFKASGTAIAMKKSHRGLKKVAAAICEDVSDHGIYKELKRRSVV